MRWGDRLVLLVSGKFTLEDPERFRQQISNYRYDEIHFDSQGGNLMAGIRVGTILREYNMAVRVRRGADCASACAYAFLGGRIRQVERGGRMGVHMATLAGNDKFRKLVEKYLRSGDETKLYFVISQIEKYAAYAASAMATYLVQMGVSLKLMTPNIETDNWDIYWLTTQEMRRFNVVNTE